MTNGLEKAKNSVGGPSALARLLGGITSQAVGQWKRVPAERVLDVERVSGVHRSHLRPDIYPDNGGSPFRFGDESQAAPEIGAKASLDEREGSPAQLANAETTSDEMRAAK